MFVFSQVFIIAAREFLDGLSVVSRLTFGEQL